MTARAASSAVHRSGLSASSHRAAASATGEEEEQETGLRREGQVPLEDDDDEVFDDLLARSRLFEGGERQHGVEAETAELPRRQRRI